MHELLVPLLAAMSVSVAIPPCHEEALPLLSKQWMTDPSDEVIDVEWGYGNVSNPDIYAFVFLDRAFIGIHICATMITKYPLLPFYS